MLMHLRRGSNALDRALKNVWHLPELSNEIADLLRSADGTVPDEAGCDMDFCCGPQESEATPSEDLEDPQVSLPNKRWTC